MGIETGIEWTDATVNFWVGCHKVSQGCKFCYMFTDQKRYGGNPDTVRRCKDGTFYAVLKWREPKRIFTCSWSDFFIAEADAWRGDAWDVIRRTPQHTWQILTKRPERILEHLPDDWGDGWPNVWLGATVENQKYADERIPELLKVPAAIRFLSMEPLLEPVDLINLTDGPRIIDCLNGVEMCGSIYQRTEQPSISWCITGGESGPHARPSHPDWFRSIRDQCAAAGVAYFHKQWGEYYHAIRDMNREPDIWVCTDGRVTDSEDIALQGGKWQGMWRVGKKAAGRLLDGVEHSEFPAQPGL